MINVNVKKLVPEAIIPSYAKPGDAGMDVTATSVNVADGYIEYGTGLAFEVPEGYVMLIFPRSSVSKYDLSLANAVGVLDSQYRGELKLRFKRTLNLSGNPSQVYNVGDRVGQVIILPYPTVQMNEVDALSETERGEGGFGSTGK